MVANFCLAFIVSELDLDPIERQRARPLHVAKPRNEIFPTLISYITFGPPLFRSIGRDHERARTINCRWRYGRHGGNIGEQITCFLVGGDDILLSRSRDNNRVCAHISHRYSP